MMYETFNDYEIRSIGNDFILLLKISKYNSIKMFYYPFLRSQNAIRVKLNY